MKKTVSLLLLLVLFACELVVDIDVPYQPALTLNSFFNADSLWSAKLHLNRHVLNNDPFREIDNATVIIYENGNPIDTLHYQENGLYQSDTGVPSVGKTYSITANAGDLGSLSASSTTPSPAEITSADIVISQSPLEYQQNTLIKLKFKDDPNEKNYYQILVYHEYEYYDQYNQIVRVHRGRMHLESEDPAIQDKDGDYNEEVIFKDILFNGREIELSFKGSGGIYYAPALLMLQLRTLSEDFYNYKTTASLQSITSGDPFAQPVNVYNNIEHGFGIFAGYSTSVFTKTTPRPIITSINPPMAKAGDHIIISAENLSLKEDVYLNVFFRSNGHAAEAQIINTSENQVEVIVPRQAITGKIVLVRNGRVAISDTDFEMIN